MTPEQAKVIQQMCKARAVELGHKEVVAGQMGLSLVRDGGGCLAGVMCLKGDQTLGMIWYHESGKPAWLQGKDQPLLLPETIATIADVMANFDEILTDLIANTYDQPSADEAPLLANARLGERNGGAE
jgi:hypothetical protein